MQRKTKALPVLELDLIATTTSDQISHPSLSMSATAAAAVSSSSQKNSKQTTARVAKKSGKSMTTSSSSLWESPLAVCIVPCVLAIVFYVNGLPGQFVHDDVYAIEKNPDVRGDTPISIVFQNDFWGKSMVDPRSHKSYRPLAVLSFRLDYWLSAGDPQWFHAVNIALHACATALVVLVSMRVLRATPTVTLFAACHFAVHPIHTEAVTGIVGRADILSALFFLASLYCYSRCASDGRKSSSHTRPLASPSPPSSSSSTPSRPSPVRDLNFNLLAFSFSPPPSPSPSATVAAVISPQHNQTLLGMQQPKPQTTSMSMKPSSESTSCMTSHRDFLFLFSSLALAAAAVLCKETGLTVLGVAFMYDLLLHTPSLIRCLKQRHISSELKACAFRLSIVIVWGALILILRVWIMDFRQPIFKTEDNPAAEATSRLTRVLSFLHLPAVNLWLLLCPVTLSYDWTMGSVPLVTHIGDSRNIWTGLVYIGLLSLVWRTMRSLVYQTSSETESHDQTSWVREYKKYGSNPSFVLTMGLILLSVPFIPASNVFFKVGFVVAERILYIPSIGYSLVIAQGLVSLCDRLPAVRYPMTLTFFTLLLVLGVRAAHRNQDWMSRRSLFISGVRTFPRNAKMHYNIANLLRDEGNTDSAEVHYRNAIRLNPDHPSYHLNLGAILTNRSEAECCYQEALRLHPGHVGALVNLANVWIEDEKTSAGMSLLEQALDLDPGHAEALLAFGKTLLVQGQTLRAGNIIQSAMESRPNWASAHLYYATFLQHTGYLEDALREYMRVLDLDPEESLAMNSAARILISFGRLNEAEPLLKRALSVDPACWDCLSVLATSYSKRGQHSQAVYTLGQAAKLAPNETTITLKYVQALKQGQQSQKAKDLLQKLLARVPDDLTVLTFAYNYAMEEDRLSDAFHHIREAVGVAEQTRHSSLSKLYYERGEVYRLYKDYENALQFYKKSIKQNNHQTDAIVSAGSILYLMKDYQNAEEFYLRALAQNPGHQLARHNLAKLRNFLDGAG